MMRCMHVNYIASGTSDVEYERCINGAGVDGCLETTRKGSRLDVARFDGEGSIGPFTLRRCTGTARLRLSRVHWR